MSKKRRESEKHLKVCAEDRQRKEGGERRKRAEERQRKEGGERGKKEIGSV